MSLLSSTIDWLNNAQPVATTITNGVIAVAWAVYVPIFLIVYATAP